MSAIHRLWDMIGVCVFSFVLSVIAARFLMALRQLMRFKRLRPEGWVRRHLAVHRRSWEVVRRSCRGRGLLRNGYVGSLLFRPLLKACLH